MSCETCFEVNLPESPISIQINSELAGNVDYIAVITDKFGEKVNLEINAGAYASEDDPIVINTESIHPGTFNRHAGNFKLEIFKELTDCEPETLAICDGVAPVDYKCVIMSFFQSECGLEAQIGCICP